MSTYRSDIDRLRYHYGNKKYKYLRKATDEIPEADDWEFENAYEDMQKIVYSKKLKLFYIDEIIMES